MSVLSSHGLSRADWGVMRAIAGQPLFEREIVQLCRDVRGEDTLGQLDARDLRRAINECLHRSLAFRVTHDNCVSDRSRWASEDAECCSAFPYRENAIALSANGTGLYHDVMAELYDDEFVESVWIRRNKTPNKIAAFSVHLAPLERELREMVASRSLWNEPIVIDQVVGPYQHGPFWIDRFTQVEGYRADVAYREGPK